MLKILYICTHNRCRSILAEAITNSLGGTQLSAQSAGSQAVENVHPLTLRYLQERGMATKQLRSQPWNDQQHFKPDIVITVCDSATNETCPVWFQQCIQVRWNLPDPSRVEGEEQIKMAFMTIMDTLEQRISALLSQPLAHMSRETLTQTLNRLA